MIILFLFLYIDIFSYKEFIYKFFIININNIIIIYCLKVNFIHLLLLLLLLLFLLFLFI